MAILDCFDREAVAWVAASRELTGEDIRILMKGAVELRFGEGRSEPPIQWLSDNGSSYTALETQIQAEKLGLVPVTTPARSPQSNSMSEAFVNTLRRESACEPTPAPPAPDRPCLEAALRVRQEPEELQLSTLRILQ